VLKLDPNRRRSVMDPTSPADPLGELRALYFEASDRTIERDFARAIQLFKTLASEAERDRAAVYMEGLAQMRSEWGASRRGEPRTARASPNPARSRAKKRGAEDLDP
jgi:hypothetical protein